MVPIHLRASLGKSGYTTYGIAEGNREPFWRVDAHYPGYFGESLYSSETFSESAKKTPCISRNVMIRY